jgi:hypothetical protein
VGQYPHRKGSGALLLARLHTPRALPDTSKPPPSCGGLLLAKLLTPSALPGTKKPPPINVLVNLDPYRAKEPRGHFEKRNAPNHFLTFFHEKNKLSIKICQYVQSVRSWNPETDERGTERDGRETVPSNGSGGSV